MPRKKRTGRKGCGQRYCAYCAALLVRKRFGKRLEDRGRFLVRKYCNRRCMSRGMMLPFPTRNAWAVRARKLRKNECENCGATERLSIHHRNKKWWDNQPGNIITLCASCHTTLHHSNNDIVPKKAWRPCRFCGYLTFGRTVCNTCRTQIRRDGKPHPETTKKRRSLRQPEKP